MPGHPRQVALARLASAPERAGFVTDFDGTLAPIVNDPERARAVPAALEALGVLAKRLALVAVVSGRPVAFLRDHAAVDGVVLVGQYGLEAVVDGEVVVDPRVEPFIGAVAAAADEAARVWPELFVERKGDVAFTVHWRTAPGAEPHPDALADLAARHGLETQPGRMACELRPPLPVDKGAAVARLLDEHAMVETVAFAGDDRGDLPVFDRFDELSRLSDDAVADPDVWCIRIAVRSSEAPPELVQRADLIVDGPADLAELLVELVSLLPGRPV